MSDDVFLDEDQSLAAVKFKGRWRFFSDSETMFLLDYTSYNADYNPQPGGYRDGSYQADSCRGVSPTRPLAKGQQSYPTRIMTNSGLASTDSGRAGG